MKIATWNIGEDERYEDCKLTIDSYNYIVDTIKKEEMEVICLQEAITSSSILPTMASYIQENTELKYCAEYELSDSHINIGSRMGVIICSKYEIKKEELLPLENPHFVYSKDENTTYYSHDKGFVMATINDLTIITGHCLPFHAFKKDIFKYLNIFQNADKKFESLIQNNHSIILCGDFNYDNVNILFPNTMKHCIDMIHCPTRKDKQLDHFVISKNLSCKNSKIIETYFDHKLSIFETDNDYVSME